MGGWENHRGVQSGEAKHNLQLREGSHEARQLGEVILRALGRNPLFTAAALPLRVFPPLFNRYDEGMQFDAHVDNAIRFVPGANSVYEPISRRRLFISEPKDFEGGELVIEDTYGIQSVKLPAGDLILYPATSLHRVMPIKRGARCASFSDSKHGQGRRKAPELFELDRAIPECAQPRRRTSRLDCLDAAYHNLSRRWSEI